MADVGKLRELLERCKAATAPDRELDDALAVAFAYQPRPSATGGRMTYRDPDGHYIGVAPYWTDSVDAALALVERVLPGCAIETMAYWPRMNGGETADNRHAYVTLRLVDENGWGIPHARYHGEGSTPALAVVCGTLAALISNTEPPAHDAGGEG